MPLASDTESTPNDARGLLLSHSASKALRFLEAWQLAHPAAVSRAELAPLFAFSGRQCLEAAIDELCRLHYLRPLGLRHFVLVDLGPAVEPETPH